MMQWCEISSNKEVAATSDMKKQQEREKFHAIDDGDKQRATDEGDEQNGAINNAR